MNKVSKQIIGAALVGLLLSSQGYACTMCMGEADAPIAPAVNASMGLLLGILVVVGSLFFRFLLFLAKQDGVPISSSQGLAHAGQPSDSHKI